MISLNLLYQFFEYKYGRNSIDKILIFLYYCCTGREISSGLHISVEREFNRIIKYDTLCGKLPFIGGFFSFPLELI